MATQIRISLGDTIAIPNMFAPNEGGRALPIDLDFSGDANVVCDLEQSQATGAIETIQAMKVDNSQNNSQLTIIFPGTGGRGDRHIIQAYKQEWLPVTMPHGPGKILATTTPGIIIPIILYNVPVQMLSKGPADANNVLPTLTAGIINLAPSAAGDNTIVPAVVGQVTSLYRMLITVDNVTNITFKRGATVLSGPMAMFAGGSLMLPPNGAQPWLVTGVNEALILNSSAAVNIGGMFGYRTA